jgi:hypothetical protein
MALNLCTHKEIPKKILPGDKTKGARWDIYKTYQNPNLHRYTLEGLGTENSCISYGRLIYFIANCCIL